MKTRYSILALLTLLLMFSCERDEPEVIGPSLNDVFGDFTLLQDFEVSANEVDFSSGEQLSFSALFSKQVDWEVRITGLESGAIRSVTGFSAELSGANAVWNGNVNTLPMFRQEDCAVQLRVVSDSLFVNDTISVTGVRALSGTVIADFENGIQSGWNIFAQTGANMSFGIREAIPAAQGEKYYDMGGEVSWDFLIGLLDFPATAYENETFGLSANPASEYFNVMLYKPEGINNEIVLFQFREDDDEDGTYTSSEDMFSLELRGLDVGWQLVSIKYEDLPTLINGQPSSPLGNGIYEPQKLHMVSCLFLADPASGYSQTLMDYLVFTQGGPLVP